VLCKTHIKMTDGVNFEGLVDVFVFQLKDVPAAHNASIIDQNINLGK